MAAERACGLRLSDEAGAATVAASGEDVAVVLDNLVENAIEHTAPGTTRHDRPDGRRRPGADRRLRRGSRPAPGEEEQAFERFFRGSSKAGRPQGSGLGLPIVRALARHGSGEATLARGEGGGARAEVRLPRTTGEPEPADDRAPAGALGGS